MKKEVIIIEADVKKANEGVKEINKSLKETKDKLGEKLTPKPYLLPAKDFGSEMIKTSITTKSNFIYSLLKSFIQMI